MEEEWKKADELATKTPDFLHLKEKPVELIKIVSEDDLAIFGTGATHNDNAYDGELTQMTFNHVKSSKAFTKPRNIFDISVDEEVDEGEYQRWMKSTQGYKDNKKSEDGWSNKTRKQIF